MQEVIERTLNAQEADFLKNRMSSYEQDLRSSAFVFSVSLLKGILAATLTTAFAYFVPKYKLTPLQYVFMFLVIVIALSVFWIRRALAAQGVIEDTIIRYNDIILTNSVVEYEIRAGRYLEVETEEGGEHCFLFELADKKNLLVSAYSTATLFPTNIFSISCILDARGTIVEYCLVGKEPPVEPNRKLILTRETFALIKAEWNMTVLECDPENFETFLRQQGQTHAKI